VVRNAAGRYNLRREKIGNNFRTAKHYSAAGPWNLVRQSGFERPPAWHPDYRMTTVSYFELFAPQQTFAVSPLLVAR